MKKQIEEKMSLGFSEGSLMKTTLRLLKKNGIEVIRKGLNYEVQISGSELFSKGYLLRPRDISRLVKKGKISAALIGLDFLREMGDENNVEIIESYNFAKKTNRAVMIVVFSKKYKKIIDRPNITVKAEYCNIARQIFKKAQIFLSDGKTEANVVLDMDYGVGVVETGASLKANGLHIVKVLFESPVLLIAKKRTPEIEIFGKLLKGALLAESYQTIKMNVSAEVFDRVVAVVPALESPTINKLYDGSFSLESVVRKDRVSDLLIKLNVLGARDILVQDLNIVLS